MRRRLNCTFRDRQRLGASCREKTTCRGTKWFGSCCRCVREEQWRTPNSEQVDFCAFLLTVTSEILALKGPCSLAPSLPAHLFIQHPSIPHVLVMFSVRYRGEEHRHTEQDKKNLDSKPHPSAILQGPSLVSVAEHQR